MGLDLICNDKLKNVIVFSVQQNSILIVVESQRLFRNGSGK